MAPKEHRVSDAYETWFENRWKEKSPPGTPPQYTDENLQEAFLAGTTQIVTALNDQLTKARQAANEPRANRADKERAQAIEAALLEVARSAGLSLYEGPSGEWVDEEALKP